VGPRAFLDKGALTAAKNMTLLGASANGNELNCLDSIPDGRI